MRSPLRHRRVSGTYTTEVSDHAVDDGQAASHVSGRALASVSLVSIATAAATESDPTVPPAVDPRIYDIVESVSAERLEADVRKLVSFGTRNTLSETESSTHGIGAARRWIKAEFERISAVVRRLSGSRLRQSHVVPGGEGARIPLDNVEVVNVLAILRGTSDPERYVIMSGDIDSRVTRT